MRAKAFRPVPAQPVSLADHRRWPLCRLVLTCSLCGWAKGYDPERIVERLRHLRIGGYPTPPGEIARRVAWPCPMCHRVKWRSDLAWPADVDEREIRRLAAIHRN